MQLLVIKQGKEYFRFTPQGYERCPMQKASVYPVEAEDVVRRNLDILQRDGLSGVHIFRLTIIEEPFT